jgi:hypothetical protein
MHHVGGSGTETFGESQKDGVFGQFGRILAEVGFDKVLEEVFLLPTVKWLVEGGLKFEVLGGTGVKELVELLEGGAVVGLAFFERGILETEEILIAEVFNESNLTPGVVVKDLGNVKPGFFEKFGDRQKVGVVRALKGVVDADKTRVIVRPDSNDGPA